MPDPNLFQNPPTMAAQHMVWSNVSGHPPSSEVLQVKVVKTMDGKTANEAATGLFVRGSEADSTPLLLQLAEELSRLRRDITQLQEGQLKVTAKNEALTAELDVSRESTASLSTELDASRESTRDAHSRIASLSAELDASRDDLEAARLEREVLRNNVAKQNTLMLPSSCTAPRMLRWTSLRITSREASHPQTWQPSLPRVSWFSFPSPCGTNVLPKTSEPWWPSPVAETQSATPSFTQHHGVRSTKRMERTY